MGGGRCRSTNDESSGDSLPEEVRREVEDSGSEECDDDDDVAVAIDACRMFFIEEGGVAGEDMEKEGSGKD